MYIGVIAILQHPAALKVKLFFKDKMADSNFMLF